MAAWGYEFYLLVLKVSLSALEDKIRIPARPWNILYISTSIEDRSGVQKVQWRKVKNCNSKEENGETENMKWKQADTWGFDITVQTPPINRHQVSSLITWPQTQEAQAYNKSLYGFWIRTDNIIITPNLISLQNSDPKGHYLPAGKYILCRPGSASRTKSASSPGRKLHLLPAGKCIPDGKCIFSRPESASRT